MFYISTPNDETHQKPPHPPRINNKALAYFVVSCAAQLPVSVLGGTVPFSARDTPSSANVKIPQQSKFQRRWNVVVEILEILIFQRAEG